MNTPMRMLLLSATIALMGCHKEPENLETDFIDADPAPLRTNDGNAYRAHKRVVMPPRMNEAEKNRKWSEIENRRANGAKQ